MFTSTAFEVALGLIFIYLVLSIICTGLSGATAALFGIRGHFLRRYIRNFVGDEYLVERIYNHPLIHSVEDPRPRRFRRRPYYPARIPGPLFSLALVDLLMKGPEPTGLGDWEQWAERKRKYEHFFLERENLGRPELDTPGLELFAPTSPKEPLMDVITAILYQLLGGDVRRLPIALAELFEFGTQIVAEQVRRWTRVYLWFWALTLTIALNVNTTFIAEALWDQASGERIESIPIGWSQATEPFSSVEEFAGALVGWLLTAGAISFGADFWLGLLERLSRGRPADEKDEKEEREKRDSAG